MLNQIKGLHHVTSMAANARQNNQFFTRTLGLRRVKKTVNFDQPDVYHLYYGDEQGTPGTVMTYFPFPRIAPGRPGAGEVAETVFAVGPGALAFWRDRLQAAGVRGLRESAPFGEGRLHFTGPDGDAFALVEGADDPRAAYGGGPVPADAGIRGFRGVSLRLRDGAAMAELLEFMNYQPVDRQGDTTRYAVQGGNGADVVELEVLPGSAPAQPGAGSVHHVAFAVDDRQAQLEVRRALMDTGYQVTPVIDRDYFWAIYFRTPGGVLFEVATNEPGFERDEERAHLGEALKLPSQYTHLRERIEALLPPLDD
ncbi:MAG: ring-cleaving dioxygenase [Pararhodobacter sp.]